MRSTDRLLTWASVLLPERARVVLLAHASFGRVEFLREDLRGRRERRRCTQGKGVAKGYRAAASASLALSRHSSLSAARRAAASSSAVHAFATVFARKATISFRSSCSPRRPCTAASEPHAHLLRALLPCNPRERTRLLQGDGWVRDGRAVAPPSTPHPLCGSSGVSPVRLHICVHTHIAKTTD